MPVSGVTGCDWQILSWKASGLLGDVWKFSHPYQVALDLALGKKHTYRKGNSIFYRLFFGSVGREASL